jgi:histidinol-phosphate/aromatic aminotransferase/cobyric acid decarboxylase-like protein
VDRLAQAAAVAAVNDTSYYQDLSRRIIATRTRVAAKL